MKLRVCSIVKSGIAIRSAAIRSAAIRSAAIRSAAIRGAAVCGAVVIGCGSPDEAAPCDTDAENTICTIAGSGENGYDQGADEETLSALEAKFSLPQDTLTAKDGTIFILDWNNHRIRKLEDGNVSWIAGRGELGGSLDDPANGDFNHPTNLIFDKSREKLIIAAWHNSKIRVLDLESGKIEDSCGDGKRAYFGDEGSALTASLSSCKLGARSCWQSCVHGSGQPSFTLRRQG